VSQQLLSHDFLRRLDQFRLAPNQPARGHLRGLHRSNRAGSGMEFKDFRPYSEGDDLKNVDWRTYMRMDRLVIKLFVEEADLPIYIFLDTSASMQVGEPSKIDYGRKVAAALAHIGFINMDRVSLIAVGAGLIKDMSSMRGKNQSWPAFRFLEGLSVGGPTALAEAFKRYFAVPRARGLIVVISDFLDPAGFEPGLTVLRHFRQDVLALHLVSPQELNPDVADEAELVDVEDGSVIVQRVTPTLIEAYKKAFDAHCAAIDAFCNRNGWAYVRAVTDTSFEDLVLRALRSEGLLR
jgi:uncharacterized protein (DUF58 family)